jgi:acyl transferase domain-containing protein
METAAPAGSPAADARVARAYETIRKLRAQLDEQRADQDIAIVGIGLRLPGGAVDLGSFWRLLADGADLVAPMPRDRMGPFAADWEGVPRKGGFLEEVLDFDAEFFGIAEREARSLDPQHRLLLEVSWEALEDAALPPDALSAQRVGLFVGIMNRDYDDWQTGQRDAIWGIGNAHCYAAGRVSYTLGFTGPAMAIDTSCSSSLVAVHLARQALARGECDIALAAGVNLIMSPNSTRLIAQSGLLAADGLCKPFDARANGFTRSEGCGVVVLKRLPQALRDRDRVHAVIRGSAVNQDGRSASLTAPNVLSQTALIKAALADAGLSPADVGVLEAHGTGTALGDPIETEAIVSALDRTARSAPLLIGAVKANLGHLESAAGITGLIKSVLTLKHGAIPPLVHFDTLNPRIDLSDTGIVLPRRLEPWPDSAGSHVGVSSFGMSGTNAHIILGAAQPQADQQDPLTDVTGFELSAKTPATLREMADRHAGYLAELDDKQYPAYAYTATFGRARHEVRAWIPAADRMAAIDALRALTRQGAASGGTVVPPPPLPRAVSDLPAYPWARQRYVVDFSEARG